MSNAAIENWNYWNDPRAMAGEYAAATQLLNGAVDERNKVGYALVWPETEEDEKLFANCPTTIDEDIDEPIVAVQFGLKYEVCNTCDGDGKHVNPSIDAGGLTWEDFSDDPDFAEDYFAGRYDVTCNGCGGKRVQHAPNLGNLTEVQKRAVELRRQAIREELEYLDEVRAERRMGC